MLRIAQGFPDSLGQLDRMYSSLACSSGRPGLAPGAISARQRFKSSAISMYLVTCADLGANPHRRGARISHSMAGIRFLSECGCEGFAARSQPSALNSPWHIPPGVSRDSSEITRRAEPLTKAVQKRPAGPLTCRIAA